jgi:hypothetical protein
LQLLWLHVPELLSVTLSHRLLQGAYSIQASFCDRYLYHPTIDPTTLSHDIAEPLETIE